MLHSGYFLHLQLLKSNTSYHIISSQIASCQTTSCHITSCNIMTYHFISCHVALRDVMLCYTILCYAVLCHVTSLLPASLHARASNHHAAGCVAFFSKRCMLFKFICGHL
jgi:hypothetical protein